jgi:hypothetical protein
MNFIKLTRYISLIINIFNVKKIHNTLFLSNKTLHEVGKIIDFQKIPIFLVILLIINLINPSLSFSQRNRKPQSDSTNQQKKGGGSSKKGIILEKDSSGLYGYHTTTYINEVDWFENQFLNIYLFENKGDSLRIHSKSDSTLAQADSTQQSKISTKSIRDKSLLKETTSESNSENTKEDSLQVFSPEEIAAYQKSKGYAIDTSLTSFQRYNIVESADYKRQDLSNSGTASQHIFDKIPTEIGVRWGVQNLRPYLIDVNQVAYYDTQSPMTEWRYSQGGDGRIRMDIRFARNITPQWNIGFLYGRANGRVLKGYKSIRKNDFQSIHENMLAHTSYQTKGRQYRLLAHFYAFRNNTKESGGIHADSLANSGIDGVESFGDLFQLSTGSFTNRLTDVKSYQRESRYYLYHQLGLLDSIHQYRALQLFQSVRYQSHKYSYTDLKATSNFNSLYHNFSSTSSLPTGITSIQQEILFDYFEHRIGVKGTIAGRIFWAGHYKTKIYHWQNNFRTDLLLPFELPTQHFLGGNLRIDFDENTFLRGKAEYILDGNYQIEANLQTKWGRAGASSASYQADPMWLFNNSPVFYWNKSNKDMTISKAYMEPKITIKDIAVFQPFAEIYAIDNYIYYNRLARASYLNGKLVYALSGLKFDVKISNFRQIGLYQYTLDDSKTGTIRMPQHFINYQIFWEKRVFNKILFLQTGFDFHWNSGYYADGFMPLTQQFYIQDKQKVGDYLQCALFINARLKKTNLFCKVTNVTQGLFGKGYFYTPDYMGQPRQLEFGLLWQLFD